MVAVAGQLDRNAGEVRLVEQMARQLRAGAGQVRPLRAVARDRAPHQKLRAEEEREEGKARDGEEDGHGVLCRNPCAGCHPAPTGSGRERGIRDHGSDTTLR